MGLAAAGAAADTWGTRDMIDIEGHDAEVIVVGAGPTGLMLAGELGRAGVRTLVLDAATERSRQSRAGSIQPRTAEVLDARGLLDPLLAGRPPADTVGGHLAGLPVPLDYRPWQTRWPHPVTVPQYDLEVFLAERLAALPTVQLHTGCALAELTADDDGVTVVTADGTRLRAAYLVGCDGAHSRVRAATGVAFPGRSGRYGMVASDITLTGPDLAGLPHRLEHFSQAVRANAEQQALLSPLRDGVWRFLFGGPDQQGVPRDVPVTEAEIAKALQIACGDGLSLTGVRHASRFSDASRQVERYRLGRVLLAGDAAHIHLPAGGQGINLGIQDAMNLGWKLAARLRGDAGDALLDSYHDERHPVAARVLANTRAQGVLMSPADPDVADVRDLLTDLLRLPAANRRVAGMISGLDVRYELGDTAADPLLGARLPDAALTTDAGPTRVAELLRTGRGLLLEFADPGRAPAGFADRVDTVAARPRTDDRLSGDPVELPGAALVRPDGHVCWTDRTGDDLTGALSRWFGPPR
jgi:2-polyprenyl-6-methoxyphenol hydroxylase-like FAD-dependent oxidoreductase